jgi:hypothetical protein
MNTQITTAMLVSVSLILAALVAVPAMNYAVYAGGDDDDDDGDEDDNGSHGCKKHSVGYDSSEHKCFHED